MNPVVIPVIDFYADSEREISAIRSGLDERHRILENPIIFHELLTTDLLPEHEKLDNRLADEAVEIVAAGIVTSSWALATGTFHILNDPSVLDRLRTELKQHFPDGLHLTDLERDRIRLDWPSLERLLYLSGCVKESIRLASGVVARSPRMFPDREIRYRDYVIPRGIEISMSTWNIANDTKIFPNPTEFRPERWISADVKTGQSCKNKELEKHLVTFGRGARQCAGMNLAYAELYIILAVVFRAFDMTLFETDASDVTIKHGYMVPYPKLDTKGVRTRVRGVVE